MTSCCFNAEQSSTGSFVWVDGPIVKAMIEGYWIVLDNANLCNSAVLDRLNSLFEADGSLVLTEQGGFQNQAIRNIIPHPNFRLFMTVNPGFGEISRAMRNRGIEMHFFKSKMESDLKPNDHGNEISCNSFAQLSPLLDSFSFNFFLDRYLMIKYGCAFSTALFLSSFHNETDKQIRSKLTGIDCHSDYLISMRNALSTKKFDSTNNFCYSGKNAIITSFLRAFDDHFHDSISIKELIFRIYVCTLENSNDEIINTVLKLVLKNCSLPNIKRTFQDYNPAFESYWSSNFRLICFSSQEMSNYFKKICNIVGYPRQQHYELFVEYLSNSTFNSQLPSLIAVDNAAMITKFPEHNYAKKFVCPASENIWSKFLLMEHFYSGSFAQSNSWVDSALCHSNLPTSYVTFCGNEYFKLNSFMFALQEKFTKPDNFNSKSFLQEALDICGLFKNSKLFQIPNYLHNINQIIDCFHREWAFISSIDRKCFPFQKEFSKLTGICKEEVLENPAIILEFIRSAFLSPDLAIEFQCKREIQNENARFVEKANSVLAEYSMLKYGFVRSELLFDENVVVHVYSNESIYRTYQFEQLSNAIVNLLDRISRQNYDFSNLHDFIENVSKRFAEYPDYISAFGFLIYLYAYMTAQQPQNANASAVFSLEYFHLYYLLSRNSFGLVKMLLSATTTAISTTRRYSG